MNVSAAVLSACSRAGARAHLLLPPPQHLPRQGLGRDESAPDRRGLVETPPACTASRVCLAVSPPVGRGGLGGVVVRVVAPQRCQVLISGTCLCHMAKEN